MNKVKRVRFTEPVTSSRNIITKKASTSNLASNKPMLSSIGVKPSTSASGSQPSGNTKKDKILQTQSSTQMNKVEAHPRKVQSSLKNKDHVVAPKGTAHVQHSKLNANSTVVPKRTTVEIILTVSPKNKAYYVSEKEAIHLLLTGIGDEIYSTVDACKTAHEMWIAIERLQQGITT
ncbi:hypothetical protein Tco_1330679 [Tanacetum coccineum]